MMDIADAEGRHEDSMSVFVSILVLMEGGHYACLPSSKSVV
jgi:hypothetical protein